MRAPMLIGLLGLASLAAADQLPGPEALAEPLLSGVRQLIFEGLRSGEGYFSADGRQMVFQSERQADNPFYQIYLMDLETGDTRRISSGRGKTSCAWIHPDGKRVLFAATHDDPAAEQKQQAELDKRAKGQGARYSWSFDEHYELYEADSEGRILRRLTNAPGYDAEGSWSPDGSRILFASNRHAYQGGLSADEQKRLEQEPSHFMELYIMDADGGKLRRLTHSPGYDGGPFFSADGERIVWRRFAEDGHSAEIWTMAVDGSGARPITRLGVLSWAPYFHPSGDYVIFANNSQGYGNFELYLVDSAGKKRRYGSPRATASTACRCSPRTANDCPGAAAAAPRRNHRSTWRTGMTRRRARSWAWRVQPRPRPPMPCPIPDAQTPPSPRTTCACIWPTWRTGAWKGGSPAAKANAWQRST